MPKEVNEGQKLKVVMTNWHPSTTMKISDEIPYRPWEKVGTDLCAITFNSIVFGQAAHTKSTN